MRHRLKSEPTEVEVAAWWRKMGCVGVSASFGRMSVVGRVTEVLITVDKNCLVNEKNAVVESERP